MKNISFLFFCMGTMYCGCNEPKVTHVKSSDFSAIAEVPTGGKRSFDTSINGMLFLKNERSITGKLGDIYGGLSLADESVHFESHLGTQRLVLHHELGGSRNSFDKFTVNYSDSTKPYKKINVDSFYTESHIFLNMNLADFETIYWVRSCEKKTNKDSVSFFYDARDYMYSAVFLFYKNKLIEFSFGYDTP